MVKMSKECKNCGGKVSDDYIRVFSPDSMDTVRVCPNCDDMVRDGSEIREKKTHNSTEES